MTSGSHFFFFKCPTACAKNILILIDRWIWSHKKSLCISSGPLFNQDRITTTSISNECQTCWYILRGHYWSSVCSKKYLQSWLEIMESRPTTCIYLNVRQSFIRQQLLTFRPLEEVEHVRSTWGKPKSITRPWQTTGNSYIMAFCTGKVPLPSVKMSRTSPSQFYL